MKKLLMALACVAVATGAYAQLKVTSNGQVQVGNVPKPNKISGVVIKPGSTSNPDTTANLIVADESSARIALGGTSQAHIASKPTVGFTPNSVTEALELYGAGGFWLKVKDKTILSYVPSIQNIEAVSGFTADFNVTVSAPQYLTTSDARCKTDIEPLENMGSMLREIAPVSYVLVSDESDDATSSPANSPRRSNAQDSGNTQHQYGFLAQDVREVYPELVYEDSDGMLSIDYTGFIPILVDAIQSLQLTAESLQSTVDAQAAEIESLKGNNPQTQQNGNGDTIVASLSQNRPNPFRTSTVINCVLPDDVSSAFLCIYDLNGNQKMRRDISDRGAVELTIEGNSLNAGMYIYTLVADGIEIDSKRMILTD